MKKSESIYISPKQIVSENILLTIDQLTKVLAISRTTLDKYRKQQSFPKPVGQTGRPRWITEEIIKWLKTERI